MSNASSDKLSPSEFRRTYRTFVIGAGIVGLAIASLLHDAGFNVTILERDVELQTGNFSVSSRLTG